MRVLFWHLHTSYTNAFVAGRHEYLLPVDTAGDAGCRGLEGHDWPRARGASWRELRGDPVDVVVLQRPGEIDVVHEMTGRRPGRDIPAVYLEHSVPGPDACRSIHPLADSPDIPIVHVSDFNRLYWDSGRARTFVIHPGIPDPGLQYTGELDRIGVVINDPVVHGRAAGTDLLPRFGRIAAVDVFGRGGNELIRSLAADAGGVHAGGDLPPARLATELARHRVYLHPSRWTSLGFALLEAMQLGMPIVAVPGPGIARAVPTDVGVVSADVDVLCHAVADCMEDPELAREMGARARRHALVHYGHERFLRDWDDVLVEVAAGDGRERSLATAERRLS
ncbi:glycosyltransferase [Microbacterium rhizosphaerae]|uniref:Glycosyltransferase n=1 Tax=Microbacterium rhizosphaerae TaxID=1678237 RepID=A0ABZ0SJ37_9MICO|nr:glycosyltransferase [Microbacterium rhizosphaerae]WPR89397.1 glycosyltransferase [Microbacterium rhizosphaerae]